MEKMIITGICPISPIGISKESFWDSVQKGSSGIGKITKFQSVNGQGGGEIRDLRFEDFFPGKKFRRIAEISKYTLLSCKLAIQDSGAKELHGEKTALVVGLTQGALNYTVDYHHAIATKNYDSISPILFSDSVLNSPAGNASICFGIQGPVHTLAGGNAVAGKTIILMKQLLKDENIQKGLIVCAEELQSYSFHFYSQLGVKNISEGAAAIIVEMQNGSGQGTPYGAIASAASCFYPAKPFQALTESILTSIQKAGLKQKDIHLVLMDAREKIEDKIKKKFPTGSIIPLTGNAFSVGTMWHLITAALIFQNNRVPPSILQNSLIPPSEIQNIMICSADNYGDASALILSR